MALYIGPHLLPRLRLVGGEKGGDHRIAHQANWRDLRFQIAVPRLLYGAHRVVRRVLDFGAALHGLRRLVAHQLPKQRQAGLRFVPVRRRDLIRGQPHQAVAAFQRVIEEGEFMVARQCRQPQRQPRQIDRARVLIHAIEAALRHQTAGMQLLVLIRRNGWTRLRPTSPGSDQTLAQGAANLDQKGARAHGWVTYLQI